jgi:site-specific DNA recombinase
LSDVGTLARAVRRRLASPELVARCTAAVRRENGAADHAVLDESEMIGALEPVWDDLYPAMLRLLVERVDVQKDPLEVRVRAEGLASLVGELRHGDEPAARAA